MQQFAIALEPPEQEILAQIELDALRLAGHLHAHRNGELVAELIGMLIGRGGVPEHRRLYFVDSAYNPGGRGPSRKQVFERHGCLAGDIARHPHFLPHLRYLLFGADLPSTALEQFSSEVAKCEPVTSGDISLLGKKARELARRSGLTPHQAREEFFKLALDCGLGPSQAASVRAMVRS